MGRRAVATMLRAALEPAAAGPTDRDLLARFAAGDEAAFGALVARHGGMVLGVCRRRLPTEQDAEDACQATFLVLARRAAGAGWQPSAANWLYATARRVATRITRAARRRVRREGRAAAPPEPASPLDAMTGREAFAALDEELARLPARYREPLVLCYLEGLTRDEAAARLAVPVATLKSQLERGRRRLAAALTRRGVAPGVGLLSAGVGASPAASPHVVEGILAAAGGVPSAAAAALARGVAMTAVLTKAKLAVLAAGVAAASVGLGYATGLGAAGPPTPTDKGPVPAAGAAADGRQAGDQPATDPPARGAGGPVLITKTEAADGTVSGAVTAGGKPLAAGRVIVHLGGGRFVGSEVKDGTYAVGRVPPGEWPVTVAGEGVPARYAGADTTPLRVEVRGDAPKLITRPGEYTFWEGRVVVRVDRTATGTMCVVRFPRPPRSSGMGTPEPGLPNDAAWFVYPVSDRRVLFYKGGATAAVIDFEDGGVPPQGGNRISETDLHPGDQHKAEWKALFAALPADVLDRLPAGLRAAAGARPAPTLWAGISARGTNSTSSAVFTTREVEDLLLGFALVNDGADPVPVERAETELLVNGKALAGFGDRLREGPVWPPLMPGKSYEFALGLGKHFAEPGTYKVQWRGKGFESAVLQFRVSGKSRVFPAADPGAAKESEPAGVREPGPGTAWGEAAGGLRAGIRRAAVPQRVAAGTVAEVEVVVRNVRERGAVDVPVPGGVWYSGAADKGVVTLARGGGPGATAAVTALAPGAEVVVGRAFLGLPGARPNAGHLVELPAGTYRVGTERVLPTEPVPTGGADARAPALRTGYLDVELRPAR